jgi:hypothetical protein
MTASLPTLRTGVFRHVGDLAAALAEEGVAQRLALGREHERDEGLALVGQTGFEARRLDRLLHAVHAAQRSGEVARHGAHRVARELEVGIGVVVRGLELAHLRQRRPGGMRLRHLQRQRAGLPRQVVGHDALEQLLPRQRRQQLALHGLTADDHVQRRLHAQHAWQALRAAGARHQAELHLGQRNRRTGRCHP